MKILVTGASGFLGKKIVASSINRGIEVHALGRTSAAEKMQFHKADVCDRNAVLQIMRDVQPTHVLNLASKGGTRDGSTLLDLLTVNTVGTDNMLFAASQLSAKPHVFILGTAYEYETSMAPLSEDAHLNPKSPYAISKTASAYCMTQYADVLPMQYLRLFNIYGPGDRSARIIPYIVDCAQKSKAIELTGCEQLRDFMFIDDLVEILFRLFTRQEHPPAGLNTLNVGTGIQIKLKELVHAVVSNLESRGIATQVIFGAIPYRKEDPMMCVANNTKLLEMIGEFVFSSLENGVRKTLDELL